MGLAEADLAACYTTDPYYTEPNTRTLWKDNTARMVTGTPTAFLNGAKLQTFPASVEDWMTLLQNT